MFAVLVAVGLVARCSSLPFPDEGAVLALFACAFNLLIGYVGLLSFRSCHVL
jgi:ABC-type branched-subunit amino acid transport system permease subunit